MIQSIRSITVAVALLTISGTALAMGGGSGGGAGAGAGMNNYYSEQVRKQREANENWQVTGWLKCPKEMVASPDNCTYYEGVMTWEEWQGRDKQAGSKYIVRVEKSH